MKRARDGVYVFSVAAAILAAVEGIFSLSPREERVGREPERGENTKNGLLSPAPLLFFWEERENGSATPLQSNYLPNSM